MSQLDYLEISSALIEFMPEELLADLPNLTTLKINFCRKLQQFPEKFFMNQRKVKNLDLDYNGVTLLQKDLFKNNLKLEKLNLYANNIKEIHVDFTHLPLVKNIDLRYSCFNEEWREMESIQSFQQKINRKCQPSLNS